MPTGGGEANELGKARQSPNKTFGGLNGHRSTEKMIGSFGDRGGRWWGLKKAGSVRATLGQKKRAYS